MCMLYMLASSSISWDDHVLYSLYFNMGMLQFSFITASWVEFYWLEVLTAWCEDQIKECKTDDGTYYDVEMYQHKQSSENNRDELEQRKHRGRRFDIGRISDFQLI